MTLIRHGVPAQRRQSITAIDGNPAVHGNASPSTESTLVTVSARDARRDLFAQFVKRAVEQAKVHRDWSVVDIAKAAGLASNTIYRWIKGDWRESPDGDNVEAFCDALDIPAGIATAILWPGKTGRAEEPAPLAPDRDFEVLLRRLNDPAVTDGEKFLIRETIRGLAVRAPERRKRRAG